MKLLKKEESAMINKKRLIIFSSLILTFCFGLFFVIGGSGDSEYSLGLGISVNLTNNAYNLDNVSKGGTTELINFTLTMPSTDNHTMNVTEINFGASSNIVLNTHNDSQAIGVMNDTWACLAEGNDTEFTSWNCTNSSAVSQLGSGDSVSIQFNFTVNSVGTEEDINWSITIKDSEISNTTTYRTRLDDQYPRLFNINITDGNTTLSNGTQGVLGIGRDLNVSSNLMYGPTLTIQGSMADQNIAGVYLYCIDNATTIANVTSGGDGEQFVDSTGNESTFFYTTTIPTPCKTDGNATSFMIGINDTLGHYVLYNNSAVSDESFGFTLNSTVLRVGSVNVTDGTYTRSVLDNTLYMKANGHTIFINLLGENKNVNTRQMLVYYNETGSMTKDANGAITKNTLELFNDSGNDVVHNITSTAGDTAAMFVTYFNFSGTGNDTQTIEFYIVANDSNNYVTVGGPYRYKIDSTAATVPVMTVPSDRAIGFSDTITYTCASSDAGIGLSTWSWTLTKPDGTTTTNTGGTSLSDSISYSSSTITQAGVHTVKCTAQDQLAQSNSYTSSSSETFTVLYSSGAGGGGGGGGTTTVSFDIDFSGTVSEATLKAQQGVKKTFSFDGATKHTITFKEVTTNKVVLEIASDPVTVELAIGETADVDVNGDGVMDMSVTLNSIEDDKADITVMKYEEGAEIIKAEEEAARGVEEAAEEAAGEEPTVTEPEVESKAWIWILVLVIAVVGVVAYFVMRKK